MSKKFVVFFFSVLIFDLIALLLFFRIMTEDENLIKVMRGGVRLVGLTDISLVTEAKYIRHRSLSDLYSIFDYSPEAREVFPFSFVYSSSISYTGGEVKVGQVK